MLNIDVATPYAKRIKFEAEPTTTIKQLKETIFQSEGIPPQQQHLYWRRNILKDDGTLALYMTCFSGMQYGPYPIFLFLKVDNRVYKTDLNVFVKHPIGKTHAYSLPQSATIKTLRKMISDKEGGPPDHLFYLIYGTELLGTDGILADHFIEHESTIQLLYRF
ncbi:unnamed protein product [Mucor fragilis]